MVVFMLCRLSAKNPMHPQAPLLLSLITLLCLLVHIVENLKAPIMII